ncbi:MAG: hypothetical protein FJW20_23475 [Acidimicrobiia bacterium]|nr:hypothetical protein [Acidimicrobiia bacterium]
MRFLLFFLSAMLFTSTCFAEAVVHPRPGQEKPSTSFWKASLLTLAASGAADVHSSLGRRELNPMLRSADGRFGLRGIAIKSLITGGAIGIQYLLVRKAPQSSKYAAIANFGMSAMFTRVAVHNYGNAKAAPRPLIPLVKPEANFDPVALPSGF